jgi:CubicO group peptidase (beta-lactamase class C family)
MIRARFFLISVYILLLGISAHAQKSFALLRSTPEAEGVSSQAILDFLDAAGKSKHEFHSYMILRHGKVIAEGWWSPYQPELKHSMYSVSKSFTATAVGFAISEGRLKLTDKVISFFPNDVPDSISQNLSALTVKDLLTMSVGQPQDPTGVTVSRDSNWVKGFLSTPILHQPGTKFLYNSLATYTLSAIVQKVTGEKVLDYLKPRLFDPLGIEEMDWETDTKGINTGGWGLRIKTEDMAKFGELFLRKGNWSGRQLLPKGWVEEASTLKIIQHPELPQSRRDSSDWEQGYCYQMWRCRNNAFRADGAFGQYIIVMPDQDAVVVITSETSDMQGEINLVWKYLLPAMKKNKYTPNKALSGKLRQQSSSLSLPVTAARTASANEKKISGKTFNLERNDRKIQSISFAFNGNVCSVHLKTDTADHQIAFTAGKWKDNVTSKPGPYLLTRAKNNLKGLPPFKVAYSWIDENTLSLTLRYVESPHTETILCRFNNDTISMEIKNTVSAAEKATLIGTMVP